MSMKTCFVFVKNIAWLLYICSKFNWSDQELVFCLSFSVHNLSCVAEEATPGAFCLDVCLVRCAPLGVFPVLGKGQCCRPSSTLWEWWSFLHPLLMISLMSLKPFTNGPLLSVLAPGHHLPPKPSCASLRFCCRASLACTKFCEFSESVVYSDLRRWSVAVLLICTVWCRQTQRVVILLVYRQRPLCGGQLQSGLSSHSGHHDRGASQGTVSQRTYGELLQYDILH